MANIRALQLPLATPSVSLRLCDSHDVAALSLIGQASFLDAYAGVLDGADILAHCQKTHSPEAYAALLGKSTSRAYLLEAQPGAAPVGYALLAEPDLPLSDLNASDTELKRIYLLSRFHGTGAGQRLLQQCIAYAREQHFSRLLLGVYSGNFRALRFYEKSGFRRAGTRRFNVGFQTYNDYVLALDL